MYDQAQHGMGEGAAGLRDRWANILMSKHFDGLGAFATMPHYMPQCAPLDGLDGDVLSLHHMVCH